jgi:hypothetical protein
VSGQLSAKQNIVSAVKLTQYNNIMPDEDVEMELAQPL